MQKIIYISDVLGYNIIKVLFVGGINMEKTNKQNNLYEQFLKYSYWDLKELFKNAKTKEEQDFYITLSNLVLQKEQKRIIGE
ncbi:hypothetical protein WY13_02708 [Clostridium ljungdahlii]|uniref:Uncharacterized protein n=2 Tax=Clostridium ljungdahlii TaxID=1538 RepID=A0A168MK88_9CLOT|nr:hypothetical protein WY13_02708 [Clostridium ljungdahlii]